MLFKNWFDGVLGAMSGQCGLEGRQLAIGLETAKAFGGLLTDLASAALSECRCGRNTRYLLTGLFRQSVFGRLAGYEDVNDAQRLVDDPASGDAPRPERAARVTNLTPHIRRPVPSWQRRAQPPDWPAVRPGSP